MNLQELREQIDEVDDTIMEMIFKRLLLSIDIGIVKKKNNTEVYDGVREKEIHENIARKIQVLTEKNNNGVDNDILEESFKTIFELIVDRSKQIQRKI